jgi:hypothetical protein
MIPALTVLAAFSSQFCTPLGKRVECAYSENSDRDTVLALICGRPQSCQYCSENQLQYDTKVVENCGGIVLVLGLATVGNGIFQQSFRV